MNSYFKTTEEIADLFQQAINTLHQQGYEAANKLFNAALRFDPFNGNAHYELAIYYATAKDWRPFMLSFFICWNLDAACKDRIINHPAVLQGLSTGELDKIVALREKEGYPIKEFESIDPLGGYVHLRFKTPHKNEIAAIYKAYKYNDRDDNCFITDEPAPEVLKGVWQEENFDVIEYFRLCYYRERGSVDQPTELVYATMKQLSPYLQDVRFLMESEWEEDTIDEVVIQDGQFYFYRHFIDSDLTDKLAYFESVVEAHPNDATLRAWLCKQYLDDALYEIQNKEEVGETKYLDNIVRICNYDNPWRDYLLGKIHLKKNEKETALDYFRKAAGTSTHTFEFLYELGKLLATSSSQYEESVYHLSNAHKIKKTSDIYIYRALAYYKLGKVTKGEKDITLYLKHIERGDHGMIAGIAHLFLEAGFPVQASRLLHAALEKNKQQKNWLTEKKEAKMPANGEAFINTHLSYNADKRLAICTELAHVANAFYAKGDLQTALELYEEIAQLSEVK